MNVSLIEVNKHFKDHYNIDADLVKMAKEKWNCKRLNWKKVAIDFDKLSMMEVI